MNTSQQVELGKIFFEDGIPGFSHLQFFQLIQEDESRLFLIQSTEEKDVGFWAVDPFAYFPNYEFSLTPTVKTSLNIGENTGIAVFCIVTIRGNNQVTVNLKAPVIVNLSNRMGKQIILQEDTYLIRQPLFESEATDKK
ncbi:flagellar assembly protein FliW [Brevibacillus brevis]|uniref:flagellar assembly protein FliW n=1 Tax=Brevibacillus brevis TaxID=1393 RepID=UPI001F1BE319|nr:flagellar assembly protein FliW [Brevibacillus brevis]UIO42084.1 flagellar assembly protein FliW [Brevibacillus brevis]